MKVRVKWTKTGVLKFIGHLDVQRYFQKALMRAELPVSFSKGMSPHQIMSFAAPLGLGMTSEGEYADISFDWTYSSEEMLSRINAVMNEGISVLEFKEIDEKEKNCMAVTAAADYLVTFREGYYYKDAFLKRTQPFSMQEKISIIKKTKRSEKEVDIAPMILDIREYESEPLLPGLPLKQEGIFMKLVGSRKFTWGICSIGILLAIVSVFFLPQIIPVHFANGIADDFGNKVEIFLFPILLFIITLLTGKEKIKYFLTHSKTFLTDVQYNLMIDGVLGIILIAEIYVIYASFV